MAEQFVLAHKLALNVQEGGGDNGRAANSGNGACNAPPSVVLRESKSEARNCLNDETKNDRLQLVGVDVARNEGGRANLEEGLHREEEASFRFRTTELGEYGNCHCEQAVVTEKSCPCNCD